MQVLLRINRQCGSKGGEFLLYVFVACVITSLELLLQPNVFRSKKISAFLWDIYLIARKKRLLRLPKL